MSAPGQIDSVDCLDPFCAGLWSLWDMVANFSASGLNHLLSELKLLISLSATNRQVSAQVGEEVTARAPKNKQAITETVEQVDFILKGTENLLKLMPCAHVEAAAKRLRHWNETDPKTWDDVFHRACALRNAIDTELKEYILYLYPKDKGNKLKQWQADWKAVIGAFPDIETDIYCAVDLYALKHSTASVYYSMRIAERGLRAIAAERRVKLPKGKLVEWATWQEIIRALDAEIKVIGTKKAGKAKDAALEFYSGARADLNGFKDEYRNAVMHVRAAYDEFQAIRALTNVQAFMERLAAKIDATHQRINWGRF